MTLSKHVLLSTGATASFPSLVQTILSPPCLLALSKEGYTHLTLQIGESYSQYESLLLSESEKYGIEIRAFDYRPEGLYEEMRMCQAGKGDRGKGREMEIARDVEVEREGTREKGLVICHAGDLPPFQHHKAFSYNENKS